MKNCNAAIYCDLISVISATSHNFTLFPALLQTNIQCSITAL